MDQIKLTIRDGRVGRDAHLVTQEGGEVLAVRFVDEPVDLGDQLVLDDGTIVVVLQRYETIGDTWEIVVSVGDD